MNCPSCGVPVSEGAKFCENCGTPLAPAAQENVIDQEKTVEIPPTPDAAPTQEVPKPQDAQPTREMPNAQAAGSGKPTPPAGADPMWEPKTAPGGAQQPNPPAGGPTVPQQGDGAANGALICGILSIVFFMTIIPSAILGIIGIVQGNKAAKLGAESKAKPGKICGIVGLVLSILTLCFALFMGCALTQSVVQVTSTSKSTISKSTSKSSSTKSSSSSTKSSSSSSSSSSKVVDGVKYENARFGYSVTMPKGFEMVKGSDSDSGASYEDKSLGMTVMIAGLNNTDHMSIDKYMETSFSGGTSYYLQTVGDHARLYYIDRDDQVHEIYVYLGNGSVDQVEITYSSSKKSDKVSEAVDKIIQNFTPGDLKVTH